METKVLIEKKDNLYYVHIIKGEECNTIETHDLYYGEGMTEARDFPEVTYAVLINKKGDEKCSVEICGKNKRIIYKVDDVLLHLGKEKGYTNFENLI